MSERYDGCNMSEVCLHLGKGIYHAIMNGDMKRYEELSAQQYQSCKKSHGDCPKRMSLEKSV